MSIDKPCTAHRLAFASAKDTTLVGMKKSGIEFRKCKKCSWIIKKPRTHGIVTELMENRKPFDNLV